MQLLLIIEKSGDPEQVQINPSLPSIETSQA